VRVCDSTKEGLSWPYHTGAMRVILATAVALLALNFADEHFNGGLYAQALVHMVSQIRHSIGV